MVQEAVFGAILLHDLLVMSIFVALFLKFTTVSMERKTVSLNHNSQCTSIASIASLLSFNHTKHSTIRIEIFPGLDRIFLSSN